MSKKARYGLALLAAGAAWVGYRMVFGSPAPNYAGKGFTSITLKTRRGSDTSRTFETDDPSATERIAQALAAGRSATDCKCANTVNLKFRAPDGRTVAVEFVPAHEPATVEFRTEGTRYRANRAAFLEAVAPLGVPPELWP